jgi:hypothetical protein
LNEIESKNYNIGAVTKWATWVFGRFAFGGSFRSTVPFSGDSMRSLKSVFLLNQLLMSNYRLSMIVFELYSWLHSFDDFRNHAHAFWIYWFRYVHRRDQ